MPSPAAVPIHVVGETRVREAHAMCSGCGQRPVEKPGDRCDICEPTEEGAP